MSEPENFLSRWSRRKIEAERDPDETKDKVASEQPAPPTESPATEGAAASRPAPDAPPAFDPSTLPPIESIGAGTDIRAFLQAGVPPDLTRAALRRVWTTDPAIRDFIGMAENQWDFTDPEGVPGFGPLKAVDDVRRMVAQIMGELPDPPVDTKQSEDQTTTISNDSNSSQAQPEPLERAPMDIVHEQAGNNAPPPVSDSGTSESMTRTAALQHEAEEPKPETAPARRGRGRALPH